MEACEAVVVLSPGTSESGTGSRAGAPAEKQPVTWRRVPRFPWRPVVSLPAAPPGPQGPAAATGPPKRWHRRGPGRKGRGGHRPSSSQGPAPRGPSCPHPQGAPLGKISARRARPPGEGPGASTPALEARELDPAPDASGSSSPKPGAHRARSLARGVACGHWARVGAGQDLVGRQEPCPGQRWRPHPAATKSQACFREDPRRRPGPTGSGWGWGWRTQTS